VNAHTLTHLQFLEAESIFVLREVAAEFERPVNLLHPQPRKGGLRRGLRADPQGLNRVTPAIALTAKLSNEDVATYIAGGFAGVAGKPINVRELVQAIAPALAPAQSPV